MLRSLLGLESGEQDPHRDLDARLVAAAALLVEAARLDGSFGEAERGRIGELLRERMGLEPDVAARILAAGEGRARDSVDLQHFTNTIKNGFDQEGRIGIVEMLWEVAYADGKVHDYEASLVRRVTGLLYIEDGQSGAARRRVMDRLGIRDI